MLSLADIEDQLHRLTAGRVEAQLGEKLDAAGFDFGPRRGWLTALVRETLEAQPFLLRRAEAEALVEAVVNRIVGLGPIQPYIDNPDITEIMVNGPDEIFIEREGNLYPAPVKFRDEAQLLHVINRIVSRLGRRIDESNPRVDARLKDGSRVHAIIKPLAIKGATLTIRKFSPQPFTLRRLFENGTLNLEMATFLRACVRSRVSLIISGGTGSGKTSTLNALSRAVPQAERLITIEDTAELQLDHPNLVALEARPANVEGAGAVPIRDLVRNALRMRPDRIIVGEVRGQEAFNTLQTMDTGHEGSLTTAHANSPRDVLGRLTGMVLQAVQLPTEAIHEQIGSALELIVQQERLRGGRRKVTAIAEVVRPRMGEIDIIPVFEFIQRGIDAEGRAYGDFEYTRHEPRCLEKMKRAGEWPPRSDDPL